MRLITEPRVGVATLGVVSLVSTLIAFTVTVGADAMWLVALGNDILRRGDIPDGVPFFAVGTEQWVNVPVLGEIVFAIFARLGGWGLICAQLASVVLTLAILARAASRLGARDGAIGTALLLFALGSLASLGVVRVQLFSLPLFALLLLLLRADHQAPSRRIWLVVPLLALWGNLHGAVLVGTAVAGSHLLFSRWSRDRGGTLVLLVVMVSTLWWTPAGLRSHEYYLNVMMNEAAKRHEGLWAAISLQSPLDVLLLAAGGLLLLFAIRKRLPLWEYVALAGLLIMTAQAGRHGVWLLAFLAPRAARAFNRRYAAGLGSTPNRRSMGGWPTRVLAGVAAIVLLAAWAFGLSVRARAVAADAQAADAVTKAIGPERVTLAPSPLAESLAVSGLKIYAGNPLDALPRDRQRAYLDFLRSPSSAASLKPLPDAVVVPESTVSSALEARFPVVRRVGGYLVYLMG